VKRATALTENDSKATETSPAADEPIELQAEDAAKVTDGTDTAADTGEVAEQGDAIKADAGATAVLVVEGQIAAIGTLGEAVATPLTTVQTAIAGEEATPPALIDATTETPATPIAAGPTVAAQAFALPGAAGAALKEAVEAAAVTEAVADGEDVEVKTDTAGAARSLEPGHRQGASADTGGEPSGDQDKSGNEAKNGLDPGQKVDVARDVKFDPAPGLSFQPPKIGPDVSEAAKLAAASHLPGSPHHDADARPTPLNAVPLEIGLRALAGAKRFDIRLDPAELGRVDVRLDIDDSGQVTATLRVDRVETMHLLQRDARTLERAFEQAGLKPSDGGIDISLRDQPGQSNQGQAQREAQERQPRHHIATLLVEPDIAEMQVIRRTLAPGRIDLTI
jgi:flagellar hook-length control protein FliK